MRGGSDLLLTFLFTIISYRKFCFGFNNVLFSIEAQYFPTHTGEQSKRREQPDSKKKKKKIHEGWRDQDGKGKAHYLTGWSPGAGDRWFRQEVGQRKEGMQKGEVQTGA